MTEDIESGRLESLWSGEFGDNYVDRNIKSGEERSTFWQEIIQKYLPTRVLEVGCNVGGNLQWIAKNVEHQNIYGLDVNLKALELLRKDLPHINSTWGVARELPYRDQFFDFVFTTGVLIHQPDETLPLVMAEIVRCSRRYILCGEYFAEERTEVPYRGQKGALIKRDFGAIYQGLFPYLELREKFFLGQDQGWDDITFWIFERTL